MRFFLNIIKSLSKHKIKHHVSRFSLFLWNKNVIKFIFIFALKKKIKTYLSIF